MENTKQRLELLKSRNIEYPGLFSKINGYQGEEEFAEWLSQFGDPNWTVHRNLWLYNGYQGEMDFLILTRKKWVMIEVKNYDGEISLGENRASLNNYVLNKNPIEQVQRSLGILRRIASDVGVSVEAALVFINTHCKVDPTDACFGIPIYSRVEIRSFIQNLDQDLKGSNYSGREMLAVNRLLNDHKVDDPFSKVSLEDCDMTKAYYGFTCGSCSGQEVEVLHRQVICHQCGHVESKKNSLMRTVNEYCLIYQKETFSRNDIHDFIGRKMRLDSITKILSANFHRKKGVQRNIYTSKRIDKN